MGNIGKTNSNAEEIMVSVVIATYNHERYIEKAIRSVLMQKVNFKYEVLIGEDCSPDQTADVLRRLEPELPDNYHIFYRQSNYGSYKNSQDLYDRSVGKYMIIIEGDDYWTDERKLQMQVDFLEEHEEYVETGHNIIVLEEWGINEKHPASIAPERTYTFADVREGNLWMVATASAVYRNVFPVLSKEIIDKYYSCIANGDLKLQLLLSQYGDCYVFESQMSLYRYITSHGTSYNARMHGKNTERTRYDHYISVVTFMKEAFNVDINWKILLDDTLYQSIINWIRYLKKDRKENTNICMYILTDYKNRYGGVDLLKTCILIPTYLIKKVWRRYFTHI